MSAVLPQARTWSQIRSVRIRQSRARVVHLIASSKTPDSWHLRFEFCSAGLRRLTAGQLNVKNSLCIGVGAGALACSGGAGNNGPTDGLGGSGGSGGDGWSAGPGNHSVSNALSDVAAVNETAESTEQVILLDVGGERSAAHSMHTACNIPSGNLHSILL